MSVFTDGVRMHFQGLEGGAPRNVSLGRRSRLGHNRPFR